ncbi:MAG: hypothetical protein WAM94_02105 [Chromatiaceae bacterium]
MVGCMMLSSGDRGRCVAAPAARAGADHPGHRTIVPGSDCLERLERLERHAQVMPAGIDFDQTLPHGVPAPG